MRQFKLMRIIPFMIFILALASLHARSAPHHGNRAVGALCVFPCKPLVP